MITWKKRGEGRYQAFFNGVETKYFAERNDNEPSSSPIFWQVVHEDDFWPPIFETRTRDQAGERLDKLLAKRSKETTMTNRPRSSREHDYPRPAPPPRRFVDPSESRRPKYHHGYNTISSGIEVWVSGDQPTSVRISGRATQHEDTERRVQDWWGSQKLAFRWISHDRADIDIDPLAYRTSTREAPMRQDGDDDEANGEAYARYQIESDNFRDWVYEQLVEASRMDPDQVLPLETKADAKVIAKNMLKQLEWDVGRDSEEGPEFFEGFRRVVRSPEAINQLADEILEMKSSIGNPEATSQSITPSVIAIRKREYIDQLRRVSPDQPESWYRRQADLQPMFQNPEKYPWQFRENETREPRMVADFNTLEDLMQHAASQDGATHVVATRSEAAIYFPNSDGWYEKAKVWRKGGFWHAQGPSERTRVPKLPKGARPIQRDRLRVAESNRRVSARGISDEKKQAAFRRLDMFFGSPSAQRRGFPSEDAAAQSAATLLAAQMKLKYNTAIEIVHEWYRRGG